MSRSIAIDRTITYMRKNKCLGSGPINLDGLAFNMTRYARRSLKSGADAPVEGFDKADRSHIDRPSDRANLHGLQRRKSLKGLPFLLTFSLHPYKFAPTNSPKLMGSDPRHGALNHIKRNTLQKR